jgi:hypothetical protein
MTYYILFGGSCVNLNYDCWVNRRFNIHLVYHCNGIIGFRLIKTIKNDKL